MSSIGLAEQFKGSRKRVVQISTKEVNEMSPETQAVKTVQKTVFDLAQFKKVLLVKDVQMPHKPTEIDEALSMVGGSKQKLLDVIYDGLCEDATNAARAQIEGFKIADPDTGEPGEDYTGQFADEAKGKLIGDAILSFAKMMGYDKSLPLEERNKLKEQAAEFIRANPAALKSIQSV